MRKLVLTILCSFGLSTLALSNMETIEGEVFQYTDILTNILNQPGKEIPNTLMQEAECVATYKLLKVGMFVGLKNGNGIVSCRTPEGNWSLPLFSKISGFSFGLQSGLSEEHVVLVFVDEKAAQNFIRESSTVGLDLNLTAGPVGRDIEIANNLTQFNPVFYYSLSQGMYMGVSLTRTQINSDHTKNHMVYGSQTSASFLLQSSNPTLVDESIDNKRFQSYQEVLNNFDQQLDLEF